MQGQRQLSGQWMVVSGSFLFTYTRGIIASNNSAVDAEMTFVVDCSTLPNFRPNRMMISDHHFRTRSGAEAVRKRCGSGGAGVVQAWWKNYIAGGSRGDAEAVRACCS
jgi:hypothetical protein